MLNKIITFICLVIIIVLLATLFLINSEKNYHYCYIDNTNSVKVSPRCRKDKCEDINGNVVSVRDFIDIRVK